MKRQTGRCACPWRICPTRRTRRSDGGFVQSRAAIETHTRHRSAEPKTLGSGRWPLGQQSVENSSNLTYAGLHRRERRLSVPRVITRNGKSTATAGRYSTETVDLRVSLPLLLQGFDLVSPYPIPRLTSFILEGASRPPSFVRKSGSHHNLPKEPTFAVPRSPTGKESWIGTSP